MHALLDLPRFIILYSIVSLLLILLLLLLLQYCVQAPETIILNVKAFDESCFAISSIYYSPLIPIYKQLAFKPVWHPSHKLWAFKNETYPELMQKLLQVDFAGESRHCNAAHCCRSAPVSHVNFGILGRKFSCMRASWPSPQGCTLLRCNIIKLFMPACIIFLVAEVKCL